MFLAIGDKVMVVPPKAVVLVKMFLARHGFILIQDNTVEGYPMFIATRSAK